jgi:hypothetical protein
MFKPLDDVGRDLVPMNAQAPYDPLLPEFEAAAERALSRLDPANPADGYLHAMRELALVVQDQWSLLGYLDEAKLDDLRLLELAIDQFAALLLEDPAAFRADASHTLAPLRAQLAQTDH